MRRVVRSVIDQWLDKNGPDGVTQLAYKSGVSASTINKLRGGRAPTKASTRLAICRTINVSENELFPLADPSAIGSAGEEAG